MTIKTHLWKNWAGFYAAPIKVHRDTLIFHDGDTSGTWSLEVPRPPGSQNFDHGQLCGYISRYITIGGMSLFLIITQHWSKGLK